MAPSCRTPRSVVQLSFAAPRSHLSGLQLLQVAAACNRSVAACQDLYNQHAQFLSAVNPATASVMWQYFLSGAQANLSTTEETANGQKQAAPVPSALPASAPQPSPNGSKGTAAAAGQSPGGKRSARRNQVQSEASQRNGLTPSKRLTPRKPPQEQLVCLLTQTLTTACCVPCANEFSVS